MDDFISLIDKVTFDNMFDKNKLLKSYIRYYLSRLESMFKYDGLPDTVPAKWLERLLMITGACAWVKTDKDGLFVNKAAPGGDLDIYYIPRNILIVNPYAKGLTEGPYKRDENCVLMLSDTYAQGLMPLISKYSAMLVENDISLNIASIMSRATMILSAADDRTRASAEEFIKRLFEGDLKVIGETPFLVANQDKSLSINQLTHANDTLTQLIEYHQYIKASLYNELGLQSNYNMKRESINSNESQLNEDQLHPLIDNMLKERKEGLERVNNMFGTNISVSFDSAWEINEKEEQAAIKKMEAEAEQGEETPAEETPAEETPAEERKDNNEDIK